MTDSELKVKFKTLSSYDDLFQQICYVAYLDQEQIGYAKVKYITQETFDKKLKDVEHFFINKIYFGNNKVHRLFESGQKEILYQGLFKNFFDQDPSTALEKSLEDIKNNYSQKYFEFVDYWVNKPSIEMITIFNSDDKKQIDLFDNKAPLIKRNSDKNFRKQGYSVQMYGYIINQLAKNNLKLWQSNKTNNENKFWSYISSENNKRKSFQSSLGLSLDSKF